MLVVLRPRGTRACTARGNQRGSIAPVGWPRQLQWADGNAWTLILLSSPTTFVDKGWERLLFPGSPVGAVPVGPMYQSRSWPSEHLRSSRCEDAVGLSSCQTSETTPSTSFVNKGKREGRSYQEPRPTRSPHMTSCYCTMQIALPPPTFIGSMPVLTTALSQSCKNPPALWRRLRRRLRLLKRLISMRSGSNSTCCASSSSRDSPRISIFSICLTPSTSSDLHI